MKTFAKTEKQFIQVLEHDIKWHVNAGDDEVSELDEATIEYLEDSIAKGYAQGSLNITYGEDGENEANGWWEIVDWKKIALEFYNATTEERQKAAREMFDENWN